MKSMQKQLKDQSRTRGFTLLEMLVVVLIIGLLVTIVVVNIAGHTDQARVNTAKSQIHQFSTALDMYNLANSHYPSTEQGLEALFTEPTGFPEPRSWGPKPYMRGKKPPLDPWGEPYEYTSKNDGTFTITSYGADRKPGGEELAKDIVSDDL